MADKVITTANPCGCCGGSAPFFVVPLTDFGDTRTFAVAGDACDFIDACIVYVFENTEISTLFGEHNGPLAGPGGDYYDMGGAVTVEGSIIDITGGISGMLAFAFNLPAGGVVQINGNLGSGDSAVKSGTLSLYDGTYTLVAAQATSGTALNEGFVFGGSAFENPLTLAAGNYLVVLEYALAADAGNVNQFVAGASVNGSTNVVINEIAPTVDVGGTLTACATACP